MKSLKLILFFLLISFYHLNKHVGCAPTSKRSFIDENDSNCSETEVSTISFNMNDEMEKNIEPILTEAFNRYQNVTDRENFVSTMFSKRFPNRNWKAFEKFGSMMCEVAIIEWKQDCISANYTIYSTALNGTTCE
nr:uncharacterized protein LOC111424226 [Onthophagus taurus]XP_022913474.1 uncharacterized protein LOC111424227 [Onthophagus taurus]